MSCNCCRYMCSKNAHSFFHLFLWENQSGIKRCLKLIFICMKCDHPAIGKCPEIKLNKDMKETKQYTHTHSQFSAFVDGNNCLTSAITWLVLQSSQQIALALPPFCPPNNLMHSLPTATGSHSASYILFNYCKNIVLSLFISCTLILSTVKECSQTTTHP